MKVLLAIFICLQLSLSLESSVQICRHLSGPTHIFDGKVCDGTLSHKTRASEHSHDHHHHTGGHSDHSSPGEHHEPCSHESVSTSDNPLKVQSPTNLVPELVVTLLSIEQWTPSVSTPCILILHSDTHTRGPPGLEDPLRLFATCIRLTV